MTYSSINLEQTAEISEVICDLHDATLFICAADGKDPQILFPKTKNVRIVLDEAKLIIRQTKRSICRRKQLITIFVPTHTVPNIDVKSERGCVCVADGIFGDFNLTMGVGKLTVNGSSFSSLYATCEQCHASVTDATFKKGVGLHIEQGKLLMENTFAYSASCRLQSGNMGLINLRGNTLAFATQKGNIVLTLDGSESDYNAMVKVKNGTTNRQKIINDGAQKSISVVVDEGNVMLNFVGEKIEVEEAAVAQEQNA